MRKDCECCGFSLEECECKICGLCEKPIPDGEERYGRDQHDQDVYLHEDCFDKIKDMQ